MPEQNIYISCVSGILAVLILSRPTAYIFPGQLTMPVQEKLITFVALQPKAALIPTGGFLMLKKSRRE